MKILKKPIFALFLIVMLGLFLRSYQLGHVPQSLNWDEVSLGYNAYSILNTGKDEYGEFMPLVLRSFDDYKPALYTYLVIPFVALLGLTEQAVRLPSVIAGVTALILVYFLVIELLGGRKVKIHNRNIKSEYVALLASFFLAISPWHIQFSRIAYESNVGLTINILVFLLFLKGLKRTYLLPLSFFLAGLNIHMYQSDRVFSPLLVIFLCVVFYKRLLKIKKWLVISIITAFLVVFPFIFYTLNNSDSLLRAKGVSVYSDQDLISRSSDKLIYDNKSNNIIGLAFDNRRVEYIKATINGYISHYDLNWLFITGDLARHHAPHMGMLYIFQLPLVLIGLFVLTFLEIDKIKKIAFFGYFLLVPVPASVTSGVPHAVRTLNFVWTWEFIISLGTLWIVIYIFSQKSKFKKYSLKIIFTTFLVLSIINFLYYLNQYFVQTNYFHALDWLYGYKEAVTYVSEIQNEYDKIVVANEVPFDQSYMFFLFYLKVDPKYYQSLGGTRSAGFMEPHRGFYNYTFEPIEGSRYDGKVLYIGGEESIPSGSSVLKSIRYPDGSPAITVAEKNE